MYVNDFKHIFDMSINICCINKNKMNGFARLVRANAEGIFQ